VDAKRSTSPYRDVSLPHHKTNRTIIREKYGRLQPYLECDAVLAQRRAELLSDRLQAEQASTRESEYQSFG
jgi:hypothetical protein